jgi:serine/threonine protein kinase
MAPEAQRYIDAQEGEPTGADIWALGEIVHNMLTLKPTFDGNLRERELFKYVEGLRSFSTVSLNEAGASDVAIEFIRAAMKPEPSKRMTVQQALEHEWMGVFTRETSRPASILSLK